MLHMCALADHTLLPIGDCGTPTVPESASYTFPPIAELADVPPVFNPEPSCHAEFVEAILGRCGALC